MMMKYVRPALVGLALACMATNLAAKSTAADGGYYTSKDKEYYLTHEELIFIRPGLELEIMDVTIPADGLTEVTFRLTDPGGLPLDRNGVFTPGPVSTNFILAYIPEPGAAYVAYTTRVQTSPITSNSATQATSDSGGSYTAMGDGTYMYKFGTMVPASYDMDATHTLGIYARRDLREFDLDRYVTNELAHWVPSGMSAAVPRDIVTTETCNRCHDPLAIHGGSRQAVGLCVLCHNATQDIDPDTGSSVNMPLMVHKIHMGENLTEGYTVIGYRQSVHDYSHVVFPTEVNDCEVCHTGGTPTEAFPLVATPREMPICDSSGRGMTELSWGDVGRVDVRVGSANGPKFASKGSAGSAMTGQWAREGMEFFLTSQDTGDELGSVTVKTTVLGCVDTPPATMVGTAGAQHTAWLENPSRVACGSCHDAIDFENGVGHPAQQDDSSCGFCHRAGGDVEFDASIRGAHQVFMKSSQFPGHFVEFLDITNTAPGEKPTVTFLIRSKTGIVSPLSLNRLRFTITGPNEDFSYYNQESVDGVGWNGEAWTYKFKEAIPEDAMGSYTLSAEGRSENNPIQGYDGSNTREYMTNPLMTFAVTGDSVSDRRVAVTDYNCESCHVNISLHGNNRKSVQYCNTCHLASATDAEVRLPDTGPDQSIHMKYMIHKIHTGGDAADPYTVFGYRSSFHDYSHVEYVGDLRNCEACHVNDSQQIPLPEGLLPTTTPREWWDPMMPIASACISCHDSDSAKAHAFSNTAFFGEACASCHGEGKDYSVDRVHAR